MSKTQNQKSEIRNQKSEIRNQKSEIRNQNQNWYQDWLSYLLKNWQFF